MKTFYSPRRMTPTSALSILCILVAIVANARAAPVPEPVSMPFEEDLAGYDNAVASGPVARLQERLDCGEAALKFDRARGYLRAVLDELDIPLSSQMLVFSKTSLQRQHISPGQPRAIYFNERAYVAWSPSAPLLEVAAMDPKLGAVFYTLEQKEDSRPRFVRNNQCLDCHTSSRTLGVPGLLVRSVKTDEQGEVDLVSSISQVNQRTPLADRWGGWYVCGLHGEQTHRGNLVGAAAFERQLREPNFTGNLTKLGRLFDLTKYPQDTSDIVALLVLEHQVTMQNFITRINKETAAHMAAYGHFNHLEGLTTAFLRYLLFVDEAPLQNPIKGISGYAEQFEAQGPADCDGRSLRQFDLQTRLFKHPCSYLIYSEAFDNITQPMGKHLYYRLHRILTGRDADPAFRKIPPETRKAILDILIATKPKLPRYWTITGDDF